MYLVFTDLDGTLLDHHTYSWEAALPALDHLNRHRIPWVLVTSKTRAEVELWRRLLGHRHPFIVENGGAAYLPDGNAYQVLEWGTPYAELLNSLQKASQASGCRVRGFHEMAADEVAKLTGLPREQAVLAQQREYDEPFLILDPDRAGALLDAIQAEGRRWTKGGRFWHILGANDKAVAVRAVIEHFKIARGPMRTIGLGDGLNDVSFLNVVAKPVLIQSAHSAEMKSRVPRGVVTDRSGPAGWNDALMALLTDGSRGNDRSLPRRAPAFRPGSAVPYRFRVPGR